MINIWRKAETLKDPMQRPREATRACTKKTLEYGRIKNHYSMAMETSQETLETLQEILKTTQRRDEDFRSSTGRQGNRNTRGRQ